MRNMSGFPLFFAGVMVLTASVPLANAHPLPDARRFMSGGAFCFSLKQPALSQWRETLKLVVQPILSLIHI